MYVAETLVISRIKTTLITFVVFILRVLFLEEIMLCLLFDSDHGYYPKIVVPNSYFCLRYLLSIRFYFVGNGIFPSIADSLILMITIGSNSICLNYTEHCVMSLLES